MVELEALLREACVVCAVLALPAVVVATIVGTAVAVVQAATQVHEQTLTLLPKLMAIGALVAVFGAFGFRLCAGLFENAIGALPAIVHGA
jgi:flagellar biosynthesis protein FliQ